MAKRVKVEIADESEKDSVTYKKRVVTSIVSLATQEIGGIASMSRNSVKRIGSSKKSRGIEVDFDENNVTIDVYVNVQFGYYSVKDLAFRVQENVIKSVESMTDFKVKSVNVHVVGVTFSEEGSDFVQ